MLFQFSDENATYILEPITNEVVYNDDPNIMWIQVTRELLQIDKHFVRMFIPSVMNYLVWAL